MTRNAQTKAFVVRFDEQAKRWQVRGRSNRLYREFSGKAQAVAHARRAQAHYNRLAAHG